MQEEPFVHHYSVSCPIYNVLSRGLSQVSRFNLDHLYNQEEHEEKQENKKKSSWRLIFWDINITHRSVILLLVSIWAAGNWTRRFSEMGLMLLMINLWSSRVYQNTLMLLLKWSQSSIRMIRVSTGWLSNAEHSLNFKCCLAGGLRCRPSPVTADHVDILIWGPQQQQSSKITLDDRRDDSPGLWRIDRRGHAHTIK